MREEIRHFYLLWELTRTGWVVRVVPTESPMECPSPLLEWVSYWMGFSCKVISDVAQFTPEEELWSHPYDFVIEPGRRGGYIKQPCDIDDQLRELELSGREERVLPKTVLESFARRALDFLGLVDWTMKWDFERSWCHHEARIVYLSEPQFADNVVWAGKAETLHEIAHIDTYAVDGPANGGHGPSFWTAYAWLLLLFQGQLCKEE